MQALEKAFSLGEADAGDSSSLLVRLLDDSSLEVSVAPHDTFEDVAMQVRAARDMQEDTRLRFLCAGKEKHTGDPVDSEALAWGVHCLVAGAPSCAATHGGGGASKEQARAGADWLDLVDPGSVLMVLFGAILVLLWVLFIFSGRNIFDRTSVSMLCLMTVAFLVPAALSYLPVGIGRLLSTPLTSLQPPRRDAPRHAWQLQGLAQHQQAQQAHQQGRQQGAAGWSSSYGTAIPPRPRAPGARAAAA